MLDILKNYLAIEVKYELQNIMQISEREKLKDKRRVNASLLFLVKKKQQQQKKTPKFVSITDTSKVQIKKRERKKKQETNIKEQNWQDKK